MNGVVCAYLIFNDFPSHRLMSCADFSKVDACGQMVNRLEVYLLGHFGQFLLDNQLTVYIYNLQFSIRNKLPAIPPTNNLPFWPMLAS